MNPKDALLKKYADELKLLKEKLQQSGMGEGEMVMLNQEDLDRGNELKAVEEETQKMQAMQSRMKKDVQAKERMIE